MKTPMQELIKELKDLQESLDPYGLHDAIEFAESMLEKEKEVIIDTWIDAYTTNMKAPTRDNFIMWANNYYNKTYGGNK